MRTGFIGLGDQGGPIARRAIEAGYETTLWARPWQRSAVRRHVCRGGRIAGRGRRPIGPRRHLCAERRRGRRSRLRGGGRAGGNGSRWRHRRPQHDPTGHLSPAGRAGRGQGHRSDRCTGKRWRAGRSRAPIADHGRGRRRHGGALSAGVRDLWRSGRASRPGRDRSGGQAGEQSAVHRAPGPGNARVRAGPGHSRSSPGPWPRSWPMAAVRASGSTSWPAPVTRRPRFPRGPAPSYARTSISCPIWPQRPGCRSASSGTWPLRP